MVDDLGLQGEGYFRDVGCGVAGFAGFSGFAGMLKFW